jgi:hypothetical protein
VVSPARRRAETASSISDFGFRISDFGFSQDRLVERGAAQGQVVEREVEKRRAAHSFFPLERLGRALGDGATRFA